MWEKLRRAGRAGDSESDVRRKPAPHTDVGERLHDLGVGPDDDALRQDTYEAWAQRLRTHKQDKLANVGPAPDASSDADTGSDYWSADSLKNGDPDLALRKPDEMTNQELLAALGLSISVTDKEVQRTYRRLVMEHHPDRWQDADPSTRQMHEEQLLHVTALYNELRSRGR